MCHLGVHLLTLHFNRATFYIITCFCRSGTYHLPGICVKDILLGLNDVFLKHWSGLQISTELEKMGKIFYFFKIMGFHNLLQFTFQFKLLLQYFTVSQVQLEPHPHTTTATQRESWENLSLKNVFWIQHCSTIWGTPGRSRSRQFGGLNTYW